MRLILILIFAGFPTLALCQTSREDCLRYEPTVVELKGKLSRRVFAGPPNFTSVKKGDAREVVWMLRLLKPICTGDDRNVTDEKNVTVVQLVFLNPTEQYARYRQLPGHTVVVSGRLFHWHTAHHRTRVLAKVDAIRKISH